MTAVLLHMALEGIGALGWACLAGRCEHRWHRALARLTFALVTAVVTVRLVG